MGATLHAIGRKRPVRRCYFSRVSRCSQRNQKARLIRALAAVTEPVIELPKFEVTDSRLLPPPEAWHYAEIPGI